MTFEIIIADDAKLDAEWFRKAEQATIWEKTALQLKDQPDVETRNRKRLREGHMTEWELRVGAFRVFYDVNLPDGVVKVAAIGYKEGNKLFIRGQEVTP